VESQYAVLAGFDEPLVRSGFGYLEEIHIFCCVEISHSPNFLSKLGEILTPYPGIIFTPSSGYKTPVFKDDGTISDYEDLSLHRAKTHSTIRAKEILHSELYAFTSLSESQPSISVTASGCSEGGGNDNHGGTGEDKGRGRSDDHNDDCERNNSPDDSKPEDDQDDPDDAGKGNPSTPSISLDIQAKLFKGTGNSSSSKPFQVLEINGTLVIRVSILQLHASLFFLRTLNNLTPNFQTAPGRSKPNRLKIQISCGIQKAHFKARKSMGLAYNQVYVGVEIDTKD